MTTMEGWWFAAKSADGKVRLPHGDGRIVRAGETLTVPGPVVLCERGLHASVRAIDALEYAPGSIVCRVRMGGEIVAPKGENKLAATERTVLWMADADRALHEFAVWVARQALLRERKRGREPDKRSWNALRVKARWIQGKATEAELAAARDAAWDAARAAARAAAMAAAWDAARAAAWDAAMAAAWDAAMAAPRAAARAAANKKLETMLNRLPKRRSPRPPAAKEESSDGR